MSCQSDQNDMPVWSKCHVSLVSMSYQSEQYFMSVWCLCQSGQYVMSVWTVCHAILDLMSCQSGKYVMSVW